MLKLFKKLYHRRNYIAVLHDCLMAAISFSVSLYLRFEHRLDLSADYFVIGLPVFTLVSLFTFAAMKLYRGLWRYASLQDLLAIIKAVSLSILIFILMMFLITRLETFPRSVLFINWILLIVFLGGPRFLYRLMKDRALGFDLFTLHDTRIPVLLIGAGPRTELFLRHSANPKTSLYRVVGIADDDPSMHSRYMRGVRVYGGIDNLGKIIDRLERKGAKPQRVIIASDKYDGEKLEKVLLLSQSRGVLLSRLPNITDFKEGSEAGNGKIDPKPVAIEDLLGRPQNDLNYEVMKKFLSGRRVLITGGGGTIGFEIARQVAACGPAQIIILDNSEFNLYEAEMFLRREHGDIPSLAELADVRDATALRQIFGRHKPDIVFHAAAIKHVPIAEENPAEAVLTNVIGTMNVMQAAGDAGVQQMVMISTDKAVNPSGVMGATKRLAEHFMQSFAAKFSGKTKFAAVRFGNVLASRGSVIPLFAKQIERGGPITITHPDITRYFMTLREAVGLVILSSTLLPDDATKSGSIFVLEMGQPIRIQDMAEHMIRLSGLRPNIDIKIEITGLRPGEKLFEELFYPIENLSKSSYEGILVASPQGAKEGIESSIRDLEDKCRRRVAEEVTEGLTELLPEYRPSPA